jgi:hypothetical protein
MPCHVFRNKAGGASGVVYMKDELTALREKAEEWDKIRDSHVARIWELTQENERLVKVLHRVAEQVQINRARRDLGYIPDPDWCYACDRPKNDCACGALESMNMPLHDDAPGGQDR